VANWRARKSFGNPNGGSLPEYSADTVCDRTMRNLSLVKDSFIYTSGAFLIKAFGFFLIPIYTRFLTVEEYGILALLNIILQLASFVLLLGVSSAAMRFYFDSQADDNYQRRVYGNALVVLLIFPTLLFILTLPPGKALATRFLPSVPYFPYIFVILLIGLCNPVQKLVLGLLRVQRRARHYVFYTLSLFLFQTGFVILAVVLWREGLKGVVYAQLAANLIFWGIAVSIVAKYAKFSFSKDMAINLFLFGIPLIPYFIFIWINEASGRFMLERYSSLRDLGIFALALQFSNMLSFLSTSLENSMLPYFYETAQDPKAPDMLGNFAARYFVLFGLVSLLTFTIAQPLLLIAADAKFHEAIVYIPTIILAGWLNINFNVFYWSLMHSKKTSLISTLVGLSAALMVGLLLLLLRNMKLGIQGVIYAMVAVAFFKNIAGYFISQRYFKLRYDFRMIGYSVITIIFGAFIINHLTFLSSSLIISTSYKIGVFGLASFWVLKIIHVDPIRLLREVKRGLWERLLIS
jgi:O-antigen/teichoic acid export membrane protein